MDLKKLGQFLLVSNAAGYAGGKEKLWIKEADGSTTIPYKKGDWVSHDNFFGGEPYGGRLVAFYQKKPVWIMVYYGWVKKGVDSTPIYATLRQALMNMPKEAPFRGPARFLHNDYAYTNKWQGNIDRYFGEEEIVRGVSTLYSAFYRGGLINQQTGV